jgi:hypothetical protein
MKTREVVTLVREELGPVSAGSVVAWANRYLGESKRGFPREWTEREVLAFYTYRSVKNIGGGTFQSRAARAILMGLPLAGAIWSNGRRYVACEPSEASERVFSEGGWALPIGKWRIRVKRWMLRMGSPNASQSGWDDIVRDSLERQEIERSMARHPAGR